MRSLFNRGLLGSILIAALSFASVPSASAQQNAQDNLQLPPWWAHSGGDAAHTPSVDGDTYDTSRTVTVQGTLGQLIFANPRTWLYVQVPSSDGSPQQWQLKGPSALLLSCEGLSPSQMRPGTQVQITVFPRKDGKPGGEWFNLSAVTSPAATGGTSNTVIYLGGTPVSCDQLRY